MNTPADMSLKAEISLEDLKTAPVATATATAMEAETETTTTVHHKTITQDTSQELVIVAPGPKLNQLATMMRN